MTTQLIEKFITRSKFGFEKYGHTLERTDLTPEQWKMHIIEELMDACLYIERFAYGAKTYKGEKYCDDDIVNSFIMKIKDDQFKSYERSLPMLSNLSYLQIAMGRTLRLMFDRMDEDAMRDGTRDDDKRKKLESDIAKQEKIVKIEEERLIKYQLELKSIETLLFSIKK